MFEKKKTSMEKWVHEFNTGNQVIVTKGELRGLKGMVNGLGDKKTRVYFLQKNVKIWFENSWLKIDPRPIVLRK